ncbi:phage tail assembly chaperone GT [Salinicoccus halodurans]
MMKESDKDINEILDMPFSFFMEIIEEQNKPKQTKSLISAFGG